MNEWNNESIEPGVIEDESRAIEPIEPQSQDELGILVRASERAIAWQKALQFLLAKATYNTDWTRFGDKCSLSSAGADRIARMIGGFKFEQAREPKKITFKDEHGDGYVWVYTCRASHPALGSQEADGHYGTRDKFLGKAGGDWKDVSEINEADIRRAAQHIAKGEAVKSLLGIRALPASMMPSFGKDASQIPVAPFKTKTQPPAESQPADQAASDPDDAMRQELRTLLLQLAEGDRDEAINLLEHYTAFTGKDGKRIKGVRDTAKLTPGRLRTTLKIVQRELGMEVQQ